MTEFMQELFDFLSNFPIFPIRIFHLVVRCTLHEIGLCTSYGQINSSVVLAGDPKQLDAVTKSDYAKQLGFNTSLMERLFEKQLYKRDSTTDRYNPKFITQLVKNYRSHAAILTIPNELFYDNKLEAKASKG